MLLGLLFWACLALTAEGRCSSLKFEDLHGAARKHFGPFDYVYPVPGSTEVSPRVTVAMRGARTWQDGKTREFSLGGLDGHEVSGVLVVSKDQETNLFRPYELLHDGVVYEVTVEAARHPRYTWNFTIERRPFLFSLIDDKAKLKGKAKTIAKSQDPLLLHPHAIMYQTVPKRMREIKKFVSIEGEKFYSGRRRRGGRKLFWFGDLNRNVLVVQDFQGELVYVKQTKSNDVVGDFRPCENCGKTLASYIVHDDTKSPSRFGVVIGEDYQVEKTKEAVVPSFGYRLDTHDMTLLPNSHYRLTAIHAVWSDSLDRRKVIAIVQERDRANNVIFEWRTHDAFKDSKHDSVTNKRDPYHLNTASTTPDGNLLISFRNAHQIIKVSRCNGQVLWKLGGGNSDFSFDNDGDGLPFAFRHQHSAQQLKNGNVLLLDNWRDHNYLGRNSSRAVEYSLDFKRKVASKVWEYFPEPRSISRCCGSVQRLEDDNTTVISFGGWKTSFGNEAGIFRAEVDSHGRLLRQFSSPEFGFSYRGFLMPWRGRSSQPPRLVVCKQKGANKSTARKGRTLHLSYNGVTGVKGFYLFASESIRKVLNIKTETDALVTSNQENDNESMQENTTHDDDDITVATTIILKRHFEEIVSLKYALPHGTISRRRSSSPTGLVFYMRSIPFFDESQDRIWDSGAAMASMVLQVNLREDDAAADCSCLEFDTGVKGDASGVLDRIPLISGPSSKPIELLNLMWLSQCRALCLGEPKCGYYSLYELSALCVLRKDGEAQQSLNRVISGNALCEPSR